jgi:hypothetical protein
VPNFCGICGFEEKEIDCRRRRRRRRRKKIRQKKLVSQPASQDSQPATHTCGT